MPHPPLLLPENVAKGARNAALLFTLLGAAYRVRSQGGGRTTRWVTRRS